MAALTAAARARSVRAMRPTLLLVLALALAACSRAEQPNDATPRDAAPAVAGAGTGADTAPPVAQLPHVRYYRINAG